VASSNYNNLRACAMLGDAPFTTPSNFLLCLQGGYGCFSAVELFSHFIAATLRVLTTMCV